MISELTPQEREELREADAEARFSDCQRWGIDPVYAGPYTEGSDAP